MTPVNVWRACPAERETTASRPSSRCLTTMNHRPPMPPSTTCYPPTALFARCHQVGCGRARVHDPHATATAVLRQAERLLGGARHRDRHVRPRHRLVWALEVIPHAAESRLHAGAVFLGR